MNRQKSPEPLRSHAKKMNEYRVSETDVKPGRPRRRRRGEKKRTKSKKNPRTTSQRTLISPSELDQTSSETDDGRWKEAKSSVRT